jgi:hypothetical protein
MIPHTIIENPGREETRAGSSAGEHIEDTPFAVPTWTHFSLCSTTLLRTTNVHGHGNVALWSPALPWWKKKVSRPHGEV